MSLSNGRRVLWLFAVPAACTAGGPLLLRLCVVAGRRLTSERLRQ